MGALRRELAEPSWIGRIRDALDEDRLVVYSQPIVPLDNGHAAEEVLARMVGRHGEMIRPGGFRPLPRRRG